MSNTDIALEEAEAILHEMIIPQVISDMRPQEVKAAFIMGGQPGSGKSACARELLKANTGLVYINGDDLRAYHPKYYLYLKEDEIQTADVTQAVCNLWIEGLIRECIQQDLSFVVEGTMRKKEVPFNTARMLRDAGYYINLAVLSVPYEVSLHSLMYRYEELKRLGLPARFTRKESHDEAFQNIEGALEALIRSELFDRLYLFKRCAGGFEQSTFESEQKENIMQEFREGRGHIAENREKQMSLVDKMENDFGWRR